MSQSFHLRQLNRFNHQAKKLPENVFKRLEKSLRFLASNPRHSSLQTHIVQGVKGGYGGPIFEAYVNKQYRLTFEYGPENQIVLRNVDNHDECLANP